MFVVTLISAYRIAYFMSVWWICCYSRGYWDIIFPQSVVGDMTNNVFTRMLFRPIIHILVKLWKYVNNYPYANTQIGLNFTVFVIKHKRRRVHQINWWINFPVLSSAFWEYTFLISCKSCQRVFVVRSWPRKSPLDVPSWRNTKVITISSAIMMGGCS